MSNVPNITPGPNDAERAPEGATETLPLITNVHAAQQNGSTSDTTEISDEEAYAKLKAKRAERRRKKLIRRGIAAGVVAAIVLIAVVVTVVINARPAGTNGPVTDLVTRGHVYDHRRGKRPAQAYLGFGGLPFCRRHGGIDQRASRPVRQRGRRAHDH